VAKHFSEFESTKTYLYVYSRSQKSPAEKIRHLLFSGEQTQSRESSAEDVAEQALLAERTQTVLALEARVRQQIAVAEFSRRALECRTLSNLFEEAAPTVAKIVDVEFCEILELLLSEQSLLMIAGVGWESDYIGRVVFATDHKSQGGFALLSGVPIIVNNLNKERRFEPPQLYPDHGIVSGISVIIQGRTRPLGILGAHTTKLRKFTGDDVHFLQSASTGRPLRFTQCSDSRFGGGLEVAVCVHYLSL
jgi:hypothetical protein